VDADPELRLAIFRRCQKLDPAVAAPVLEALSELHPELVLEEYFKVLAATPTGESPRSAPTPWG